MPENDLEIVKMMFAENMDSASHLMSHVETRGFDQTWRKNNRKVAIKVVDFVRTLVGRFDQDRMLTHMIVEFDHMIDVEEKTYKLTGLERKRFLGRLAHALFTETIKNNDLAHKPM